MNKEIVSAVFPEEVDRVERGECATCGSVIEEGEFRDMLSFKEYKISGLCQACQDRVFL